MSTKVLIVSHKNLDLPKKEGYKPIQVGDSSERFDGYIRDNSGLNIAKKNPNYCELTAQYWLWKNDNSNVKGIVHYRRYFLGRRFCLTTNSKMKNILTSEEIDSILKGNDIILPKKRNYFVETNYSHYVHAHHSAGIDKTREVIERFYPDYLNSFDKIMSQRRAHMFNMMIAKGNVFDDYSEWLFDILSKVEDEVDISGWTKSESRIFGYISELLLDVWLMNNSFIKTKEVKVGFIGNQHWIKKIYDFLKRKIKGKLD